MKKFYNYLLAAAILCLTAGMVSCDKTNGGGDVDTDLVDKERLEFTATPNAAQTVVVDTQGEWSYEKNRDWIKVNKSGNQFTVITDAYNEAAERNGIITVTAGTRVADITVVQTGVDLALGSNSVNINADTELPLSVTVTTRAADWDIDADKTWVQATKGTNQVIINIDKVAAGSDPVTAKVTITTKGLTPEVSSDITVNVSLGTDDSELLFTDIPVSNAAGSGTPGYFTTNQGPTTWSAVVTPVDDTEEGTQYYHVSFWPPSSTSANQIAVFIDFTDGELFIDNYYSVAQSEDGYYGYFLAMVDTGDEYVDVGDWQVNYDKTTRTMDFGGKYQDMDVMVGVAAFHGESGAFGGAFTEWYYNAKLVLTPSTGAPRLIGTPAGVKTRFNAVSGMYDRPKGMNVSGSKVRSRNSR